MSTRPEFQRTDDEIVSLLSQWLMRTLGNDELRKRIEELGTDELAPGQRAAVDELLAALGNAFPGERAELEARRPRDARVARLRRVAGRAQAVFTGIVRELGRVASRRRRSDRTGSGSRSRRPRRPRATTVGDSVAVNGCCLTAVGRAGGRIAFDAVPETLARTSLGEPRSPGPRSTSSRRSGPASRSAATTSRVTSTASASSHASRTRATGRRLCVDAPPELLRYVVEKGSITVDGVSLTVAALDERGLRGRADPAHARRDDARRARRRRARSTSRSTFSRSTSSGSSSRVACD